MVKKNIPVSIPVIETPIGNPDINHVDLYVKADGKVYKKDSTGTETEVGSAILAGNVTFSPAGNIAASNVQTAIEELDTEKAPQATTYNKTQVDDAINAALAGQQTFSAIYAYQNFI
jgi:hypothetical protein